MRPWKWNLFSPTSDRHHPATSVLRRLFPLAPGREDAARAWLTAEARTPRRPREASSVVLLKDAPDGLRAWLGQRGEQSPLGMVSFSGGSCLETDDGAVEWFGPSPTAWATRLGLSDFALARRHVIAAIRELFEETGVLLAGPDELSVVEETSGEDWMRSRQRLASEEITFTDFLSKRGWGVRTDLLRVLSHWISPEYELRRFDTFYFAAAVPSGQSVCPLQDSGRWGRWVPVHSEAATPESTQIGDEIGADDTRGIPLSRLAIPATQIMLEKLRRTRGCVAYLSSKREVRAFRPELIDADGELMLDVTTVEASEGAAVARGR